MITFFAVILIIIWFIISAALATDLAEDYKHCRPFFWVVSFIGVFSLPAWLPMVLWRAFT